MDTEATNNNGCQDMVGSFELLSLDPVVCLRQHFLNADGRWAPGLHKWKERKNSTLLREASARCKDGRRGGQYPSNYM